MISTMNRMRAAKGILFDLDNTLYPREKGVFEYINTRINEYVRRTTGRTGQDVDLLRKEYLSSYGTTLGGLIHNHAVDAEEYLEFVHDVPVEELLGPDPSLVEFLGSIDLPLVIFTNGTRNHAERVMNALSVSPYFKDICDLAATGYLGKPHREAFYTAAGYLDCALENIVFIDDLAVNIAAGAAAGAFTIHVDGKGDRVGDVNVGCVKDLEPLFTSMPWYNNDRNS